MLETYKEPLTSIKRIIIYSVVITALLVLGVLASYNWASISPFIKLFDVSRKAPAVIVSEKPSVFKSELKPIYGNASRLNINSLGINLELLQMGVAADGSLETPHDWGKGGWYKKSARPGEKGNLIINAHYDDNYGRPAAFWSLKNIKVNDTVVVIDEYGKEYTYNVNEVLYVDINDPERLKVLETESENSSVTLITCGGVWLQGISTYSKRLVVKGVLI